ncbi:MAG: hypothetical protein H6531_02830 [Actinobacteria bacterium]|nr:hypothetical protein [Thermoleophilia bacterium]MCB9010750.1 hypothetical protein [Actinomycetota bacterium]
MIVHARRARGLAVAALAGVALFGTGCVDMDSYLSQSDGIGDVNVHSFACLSGSTNCGNLDNLDLSQPAYAGPTQLLIGYKMSSTLTPPSTIASDAPQATFAPSPGYAAELERLSPAGPGRTWIGYISNTLAVNGAVDPTIRLTAGFGLPQGADGAPFEGPVSYRAVIGFRTVSADLSAGRPVNCGSSITDWTADFTVCLDSPLIAQIPVILDVPVNDLGILTGAEASGPAGTTVTVPFTTKFNGTLLGSALEFGLSASTPIPGARITVTPAGLVHSESGTTPVQVAVAVPAGTKPGEYPVTLTATIEKQTRTRDGVIIVTAPPVTTTARIGGVVPKRLAFRVARRRGVKVLVRSNIAGTAIVRLYQKRRAPLVSKRVRLRVGRTGVLLRSRGVVAGRYRVTVTTLTPRRTATIRGVLRKR